MTFHQPIQAGRDLPVPSDLLRWASFRRHPPDLVAVFARRAEINPLSVLRKARRKVVVRAASQLVVGEGFYIENKEIGVPAWTGMKNDTFPIRRPARISAHLRIESRDLVRGRSVTFAHPELCHTGPLGLINNARTVWRVLRVGVQTRSRDYRCGGRSNSSPFCLRRRKTDAPDVRIEGSFCIHQARATGRKRNPGAVFTEFFYQSRLLPSKRGDPPDSVTKPRVIADEQQLLPSSVHTGLLFNRFQFVTRRILGKTSRSLESSRT